MKNKMEQVEECQKKMQDQNDLIMHLQRQLNEKAGIRPTYYGSNTYAPSSLYSTEVGGTSNAFRTGMMGTVTASRITNTGYNTNDKLDSRERIDPVIKRYTDTNPDKRS